MTECRVIERSLCDHYIEGEPWAGTYCKLPAGHSGRHSAHYPEHSEQSDRDTLTQAFAMLTPAERQLLVCALAGNHPERLAPLRMEVLRGLAKADRAR